MPLFNGGSSGGVGPQKFDASVDEVKEMIQDLDSDVAIVDGKIDDLQTDTTEMQTAISEINTNVVEIQQAMPQNIRPTKAIKARNQSVAYGQQNVTIANVTGSGTLYYATVSNAYSWNQAANLGIVINIDGKTIRCTGLLQGFYTIGYFAKECVFGCELPSGSGMAKLLVENFCIHTDYEWYAMPLAPNVTKLYQTSGSINENNTLLFSDYGIRFENNLTVQVSNSNSGSNMVADASVYYSLDD